MSTLEEALNDKKKELDEIRAPEELESRLRKALQGRKRRVKYRQAIALLIVALVLTYSFDSLAYYGKKFAGYDQVVAGSLKQLNESGRGQEIGKSCTFSNGVEVTIDGIMFDGNEFVAFYKVHSSRGKLQEVLNNNLPRLHVYGIKPGGYFFTGGHGVIVDDQNMTFIDTLNPPKFYEKWMRFDVQLVIDKKVEVRSINFTLDRNQAMERTTSIELSAEAMVGEYRILFDRLTASALSSVIDGRVIPLTDQALSVFKPETTDGGMWAPQLKFDIATDRGEVIQFSGGQSVSNDSISINSRSDALPGTFRTLEIKNIRIETMKLVDQTVNVSLDTKDLQIADDLIVKQIYQKGSSTYLVAASRGIPVMGLFDADRQLEQLNSDDLEYAAESTKPIERICKFEGTGKNLKLAVKYIRYSKCSSDSIKIPME